MTYIILVISIFSNYLFTYGKNDCFESRDECHIDLYTSDLQSFELVPGDSLSYVKILDWAKGIEIGEYHGMIKSLLNNWGNHYFIFNEAEKFITLGFLEDNGVYLVNINRMTCEFEKPKVLDRSYGWEHGFEETSIVVKDSVTILMQMIIGSRDWGDYQKWKIDTTNTRISFSQEGLIKYLNY